MNQLHTVNSISQPGPCDQAELPELKSESELMVRYGIN